MQHYKGKQERFNLVEFGKNQLIAIEAELKIYLPKLQRMDSRYEKLLFDQKFRAAERQYKKIKKSILAFYIKLLNKNLLLNYHDISVKADNSDADNAHRFYYLSIISREIAIVLELEEDGVQDLATYIMAGLVPHIDLSSEDFLVTFENYFMVSALFLN